jgi:hypothetical protein
MGRYLELEFAGIPGLTYTIESTSNLSGPWSKVTNFTAPLTNQGPGEGVLGVRQNSSPTGFCETEVYATQYTPLGLRLPSLPACGERAGERGPFFVT